MKRLYAIILSTIGIISVASQVSIGKNASQTGVSLEFGTGNKGLILPWVTNAAGVSLNPNANQKGGAFILDVAERKVKMSNKAGAWVDLSVHTNEAPATGGNLAIDNSLQLLPAIEQLNAKSQIGTTVDATPGILVLSDTNKAMIPPLVTSPETAIKNPAPGMIVFDPVKKLFCVYNGTVWTYWRGN